HAGNRERARHRRSSLAYRPRGPRSLERPARVIALDACLARREAGNARLPREEGAERGQRIEVDTRAAAGIADRAPPDGGCARDVAPLFPDSHDERMTLLVRRHHHAPSWASATRTLPDMPHGQ